MRSTQSIAAQEINSQPEGEGPGGEKATARGRGAALAALAGAENEATAINMCREESGIGS